MTQPEIRISLDIHRVDSQATLELSHFDSSKTLKISLTDNGLPYSISEECRAIFVASKADGTYIINECAVEDDVIIYDITAQTTASTGTVACEIRLTGGEDDVLLTSPRFSIFVVPTIYENGGAASASKNEFDALSKLITDSKNLMSEIEASLESGKFKGEQGEKGDKGDTGDAGISPTIAIEDIDNGTCVSITDINGTKSFDVHHGNGINEYRLTYYAEEPTESQRLIEKAVILSVINESSDYIVYINYDDGRHPASVYKYGENIYFYFTHPNENRWYEISYLTETDALQYGYTDIAPGGSADALTYTAQELTDEQKAQARSNIDAVSNAEALSAVQTLTAQFLPRILPSVTTADNEKFLQVVDGVWKAVTIELAEDGGF